MDNTTQNKGILDWDLFRRDVRTDVRNCALFMFVFYGVYLAVAIVIEIINESGYPGFSDLGLASMASIIIGSFIFLIPRKKRFFTDLALPAAERMTPKIFIVLVMATQGIQLVYGLIIGLIDTILPEGLSLEENYAEIMGELNTPLSLVYIILVGPIFEELIFRGAIMGPLRRYGDNFAILFSSLLFGFYHVVLMQIPFAFVMGLLFGYVAARWSLRTSIVLHIIVNGLSVLFVDTENISLVLVGGLFMIVCTIASFVFLIIWRDTLRLRIQGSAAYYPHTYANGFSSIAFWLFLVVTASFGILTMNGFLEMILTL